MDDNNKEEKRIRFNFWWVFGLLFAIGFTASNGKVFGPLVFALFLTFPVFFGDDAITRKDIKISNVQIDSVWIYLIIAIIVMFIVGHEAGKSDEEKERERDSYDVYDYGKPMRD